MTTQAIYKWFKSGGKRDVKGLVKLLRYLDQIDKRDPDDPDRVFEPVPIERSERHQGIPLTRDEYEELARSWYEETGQNISGQRSIREYTTHLGISFPPHGEETPANPYADITLPASNPAWSPFSQTQPIIDLSLYEDEDPADTPPGWHPSITYIDGSAAQAYLDWDQRQHFYVDVQIHLPPPDHDFGGQHHADWRADVLLTEDGKVCEHPGDQSLFFSARPQGLDRETYEQACYKAGRAWAEQEYGRHSPGGTFDYLTAFHRDREHNHFHIVVHRVAYPRQIEDAERARRPETFKISKRAEHFNYNGSRERLATESQRHGIDVEATSRASRGHDGPGPSAAAYRREQRAAAAREAQAAADAADAPEAVAARAAAASRPSPEPASSEDHALRLAEARRGKRKAQDMTDARNDSGDDGTSATGRRTRRRGVRAQDAVGEALRVVAEAQREASPTNNGGGGTPPEADDHDHQDRVPKRPLPQESLPNPRPAQRPRLDDADDPFASSSHLSSPAPTPPSESSSLSPPPSSRAASPVSPSPDTAPAEGATNQTPRIQENQLDLDLPSAQSSGTRATTPLPDDAPPAPHAAPGGAPDAQGAPADAPQRGRKRRTQENVHPMETRTKRAKREEEQYVMRDSTHAMETRARSNRRAETQRPSDAPRNDEPHRTRRRGR